MQSSENTVISTMKEEKYDAMKMRFLSRTSFEMTGINFKLQT